MTSRSMGGPRRIPTTTATYRPKSRSGNQPVDDGDVALREVVVAGDVRRLCHGCGPSCGETSSSRHGCHSASTAPTFTRAGRYQRLVPGELDDRVPVGRQLVDALFSDEISAEVEGELRCKTTGLDIRLEVFGIHELQSRPMRHHRTDVDVRCRRGGRGIAHAAEHRVVLCAHGVLMRRFGVPGERGIGSCASSRTQISGLTHHGGSDGTSPMSVEIVAHVHVASGRAASSASVTAAATSSRPAPYHWLYSLVPSPSRSCHAPVAFV
jgi:hypothetical protein